MRLNQFNKKEYLHHKRLAIIQKAHLPLQIKIQRIANKAVDERILYYYGQTDMEKYTVPAYKDEVLTTQLSGANFLATHQDMSRLLNKSFINQNHITNLEKYNASKQVSDRITKAELERINKNLLWVDKTLETTELNIDKYKNLMEKLPKQVSRKDMLEKALEKGQNYKGKEYSYRELNQVSRSLEKYKLNALDYETGMIENQQANREGLSTPNNTKTWIWSTLENTRHENMDGETVRFTEKFRVVNERTGATDYLRFPGDIENDTNNCSNICNCGCSYEIN